MLIIPELLTLLTASKLKISVANITMIENSITNIVIVRLSIYT